ncbi:MAG: helix-turn-helix domain-containing protein [Limisphaerales bacterium]
MQQRKEPQFDTFDSFEQFFDRAEKRADYWTELAKLEFTKDVLFKMNKDGISKTELANRLEVQPGLVTRLLNGRNNFEVSTMVRIAMALNCRLRSHLEPLGAQPVWFDVFNEENQARTDEAWNPDQFRKVALGIPMCEILNYESGAVAA